MNYIAKYNAFHIFSLLCLTFVLIRITNDCILTFEFFKNNGEFFFNNPADEASFYQKLQGWIYLTSGIYLLVKVYLIALILHIALYLADEQTEFRKVLSVVLLSEYLFFIPAVLKVIWFHYAYPQGTLSDWYKIYISSALSLLDSVPADWNYALQTLNLFEVAYWFILAYGIKQISKLSFDGSLKLVATSYIPALVLWVGTITFCSVIISPATG